MSMTLSVDINTLALAASSDERKREKLIRDQSAMILQTASGTCRRFISKSDDEWSVALYAFSRAIDSYSDGKGDFLPFARIVVKRALIDYFRSEKNRQNEIAVSPHILEGNGSPEEDPEGVYYAVAKTSADLDDGSALKEEILEINSRLAFYGFRFFDLTECSPKQAKTRNDCAAAVRCLNRQPLLQAELKKAGKLPVKALSLASGVSRKTLDKYRKYLIMAFEVLSGEYPHLADYLSFMKEDRQ